MYIFTHKLNILDTRRNVISRFSFGVFFPNTSWKNLVKHKIKTSVLNSDSISSGSKIKHEWKRRPLQQRFKASLFSSRVCTVGESFEMLVMIPASTERPSHFLKIDTAIHDLHVPVHPLIPHCDKCTGRTSSNLSASRNQVGVKSSLDGWSDGLLWLATLANQGEKRHLYSKLIYSATKAVPKEVEAFARMNADLPASLSK